MDNPQSLPQAIILAPTRDLCRQINKQCTLLAQFTDIKTAVIIGGEDPRYQIKALEKYPEIIIATPGRLLEHAIRDVVNLEAINIVVIDEADRMLAMGFSDDVITVASHCSDECQTMLYSASFNEKKFEELTNQVLLEPEIIIVDSARESNQNILQQKLPVDDIDHKLKVCEYIAKNEGNNKTIIFANKKETVNIIRGWLQSHDVTVAILHSAIDQDIGTQQLRKFRLGEINVIVATDVASRGLDIPDLDLIINFDVPHSGDDYMHRTGRTGRMHNTGTAITLVTSQDWNKMISIENFLEFKCEELSIKAIAGKYQGPDNRKTSGKAYGNKRKKDKTDKKTSVKTKTKMRVRDKKNIGKRRTPSEKKIDS